MKQIQVVDKVWVCPVCGKQHGLKNVIENKGLLNKKPYIKCSECETEFEAMFEKGKIEKIKLRKEGRIHSALLNLGSVIEIENLRKTLLTNLVLEEINTPTVFILMKEEKVFFYEKVDRKSFVKKTETVYAKNKKSGSFFSLFANKNNNFQGQNYQPTQEIREVFEKVDEGNLLITNERIAFAGKRNTFSIILAEILSIGLDEDFNIFIGTTNGQLFLNTDKPVKNEIIDTIKFLRK